MINVQHYRNANKGMYNADLLNWTIEQKIANTKKTCQLGFVHKKKTRATKTVFLFVY